MTSQTFTLYTRLPFFRDTGISILRFAVAVGLELDSPPDVVPSDQECTRAAQKVHKYSPRAASPFLLLINQQALPAADLTVS